MSRPDPLDALDRLLAANTAFFGLRLLVPGVTGALVCQRYGRPRYFVPPGWWEADRAEALRRVAERIAAEDALTTALAERGEPIARAGLEFSLDFDSGALVARRAGS